MGLEALSNLWAGLSISGCNIKVLREGVISCNTRNMLNDTRDTFGLFCTPESINKGKYEIQPRSDLKRKECQIRNINRFSKI